MFRIQFEKIIEKKAPKTSENMRALLAHLLETDITKRPSSAELLKKEIERVQNRMPPIKQNPDRSLWKKITSRISNYFTSTSSNNEKYISSAHWTETDGILHKIKNQIAYYTFEINEKTWSGVLKPIANGMSLRLPCLCRILFNPDNPRMNYLGLDKIQLAKPGINTKQSNDMYPIETARTYKEFEQLILDGANINIKDFNGNPLLLNDRVIHDPKILMLLIDAGADINARDYLGNPLLLNDQVIHNPKIFKLLIDAGADVNAKDNIGDPLLANRYIAENTPLCKLLIEAGADVNARDHKGTPLLISDWVLYNFD